jgi:hypothetical protein
MPNLFLPPLTPRSSRLQAVSDIADLVSARSRAALSVRASALTHRRAQPTPALSSSNCTPAAPNMHAAVARASSAQQHLPAGEREAILSKI